MLILTERGQLAAAIRFMASVWEWSKSKVERYLKRMVNRTLISIKIETGISVITICNYDNYQSPWDTPETSSGQPRDAAETNNNKDNKDKIRKKEKKEVAKGISPRCDEIEIAVEAYNELAHKTGWPKVQKLTSARRASMNARLRDVGGPVGWQDALKKAAVSDFLCGKTWPKPFLASFDFLIQEQAFTKLMEGNYDNRTHTDASNGPKNGLDPAAEQIARLAGLH